MTRIGTLAVVLLSLVVSPALMYVLSIDYSTEGGSILEKVHISTTLSALLVVAIFIFHGRMRFVQMRAWEFFASVGITLFCIIQLLALGRPATSVIVTFLTPISLIYLLNVGTDRMAHDVRKLIMAVLFLNSLVGIGELVLGTTMLPRVAGSAIIYDDRRSLGLVGHPLNASFITGLYLIYLVISGLMSRFTWASLGQIAVHTAALLAFGGRVALISTVVLVAIFVVFDSSTIIRTSPSFRFIRRILMIFAGLGLGAAVLFSGLADNTISRFTSDEGSALTRYAAVQILTNLPPESLAFGVSQSQRSDILRLFGTKYGIEITWIAWLVDYGVFITIGLCIVLVNLLRVCLRGGQRYHWYMTVYFLICITGSQGLGSKSLLLAWFVTIMLTFGRDVSAIRAARTPESGRGAVPARA